MSERAVRLRADLDREEKKLAGLLASGGDWEERQSSLERCHELEAELAEAEGESLLGDGTPRE